MKRKRVLFIICLGILACLIWFLTRYSVHQGPTGDAEVVRSIPLNETTAAQEDRLGVSPPSNSPSKEFVQAITLRSLDANLSAEWRKLESEITTTPPRIWRMNVSKFESRNKKLLVALKKGGWGAWYQFRLLPNELPIDNYQPTPQKLSERQYLNAQIAFYNQKASEWRTAADPAASRDDWHRKNQNFIQRLSILALQHQVALPAEIANND